MSLTPKEQFHKILENTKEVLIFLPQNPHYDAIGSAWALYFFLEKSGIKPTIGLLGQLPTRLDFLPQPERIISEVSGARELILSFDTERNNIVSWREERLENRFNVYLTPERGSLDPRDFSFVLAKFKYDLIITINCPDRESLGKFYLDNPDLFFEVPLVNIDNRSDNDNFGQINLVDLTASSCAEIVNSLLKKEKGAPLDQSVSTCLLLGIIGATNNFQKKNTTPKALLFAAELMDGGADQQKIIRWLYKTQPLNILKLLGRVMSKLNWEEKSKTVWSVLSLEDFVQSRTNPENLPIIMDKLQENYSEGRFFLLAFNDRLAHSTIFLKTDHPEILRKIANLYNIGNLSADFLRLELSESDPAQATKQLLIKIEQSLSPNT